jgi:hypothetical protein
MDGGSADKAWSVYLPRRTQREKTKDFNAFNKNDSTILCIGEEIL